MRKPIATTAAKGIEKVHRHEGVKSQVVAPSANRIQRFIQGYFAIIIPFHPFARRDAKSRDTESKVEFFADELTKLLRSKKIDSQNVETIVEKTVAELPIFCTKIFQDAGFAYREDPASSGVQEIVETYPFIIAVATHRLAHFLHNLEVQLLPRLLARWSHSQTSIDIHPGATIGSPFFIDHGTGVVIGGTTEIGDNVCIFHGVTLGALSFRRDPLGIVVKGQKRHPTIEDGVILYSGAVVLGSDTVIGAKSIIGNNVWITGSVAPNTMVQLDSNAVVTANIRR